MRQRLAVLLSLALLALSSLAASGRDSVAPVLVEGVKNGGGFAVARGAECFVFTACHVVANETDGRCNLNPLVFAKEFAITGADSRRSRAFLEQADATQDWAILRVVGNHGICDLTSWSPDIDAAWTPGRTAVLKIRQPEGGLREIRCGVRAEEGDFAVHPLDGADLLKEGMSGSPVFNGDRVYGMLIAVEASSGDGNVFRLGLAEDRISSLFSRVEGQVRIGNEAKELLETYFYSLNEVVRSFHLHAADAVNSRASLDLILKAQSQYEHRWTSLYQDEAGMRAQIHDYWGDATSEEYTRLVRERIFAVHQRIILTGLNSILQEIRAALGLSGRRAKAAARSIEKEMDTIREDSEPAFEDLRQEINSFITTGLGHHPTPAQRGTTE